MHIHIYICTYPNKVSRFKKPHPPSDLFIRQTNSMHNYIRNSMSYSPFESFIRQTNSNLKPVRHSMN